MSKKLTPWFPEGVTPVHAGVYETDSEVEDGRCYQFWTGRSWGYCSHAPEHAMRWRSSYQQPRWRGLAKKP
jgi:hypothetical protein